METKSLTNLFVYGTLKKGQPNHARLGRSKFIGKATISGELYHCDDRIAVVVPAIDSSIVHGEVYAVSPELIEVIDRFEGHPTFYKRVPALATVDGQEIRVEVYMMERDYIEVSFDYRIKSGRWDSAVNR